MTTRGLANTPKKSKRWHERTSAASRTRKSKPTVSRPAGQGYLKIGEGIAAGKPGGVLQMQFPPGTILDIFSMPGAGMTPFLPVKKSDDDASVEGQDRSKYNRRGWREMMAPWRRSKAA